MKWTSYFLRVLASKGCCRALLQVANWQILMNKFFLGCLFILVMMYNTYIQSLVYSSFLKKKMGHQKTQKGLYDVKKFIFNNKKMGSWIGEKKEIS
jgi:hypothetical protein